MIEHIKKRKDGVIVNDDRTSLHQYLEDRKRHEQSAKRIDVLENRINNIDSNLSEIKTLLNQILKATNG